jgi:hypothetical protein
MAFSNNPLYDTRSTVRMPACYNLDFFTPAQFFGQGFVNMITFGADASDSEDKLFGLTRPAISASQIIAAAGIVSRGFYVWEKTVGTVYYFTVMSAGGSSFIMSSNNGTTWATVNTFATDATTPVRFCEFIDSSTNTKSLIAVDGLEGFVFTSNAAGTKIVDADFPSPHVPFPVYLDGYLFLAKANTGDIYNSDLNNPSSWTAGNFFSAELYPDDIQALFKVKNFLLAIGTDSGEYFFDNANPTGSPLARYEGATLPFGTRFPNSIANDKDRLMFLASTTGGGASFKFVEGFQYQDIEAQGPLVMAGAQFTSGGRAAFFRFNGELLYLVHAGGGDGAAGNGAHAYIYSVKRKMWSAHIVTDITNGVANSTQSQWPAYFLQNGPTLLGNYNTTYVVGHRNSTIFMGTLVSQGYDSFPNEAHGNINIHQQVIFPPATFGTMNTKTMHRVAVNYERPDEDTTYQPVTFTYNDVVDGTQYATPINLQGWSSPALSTTHPFPCVTQLGQFRRRQMALAIPGGVTRIYFMDVDINKGQN